MMNIQEAYRILNATEQDSDKTIKLKFRKKMRLHHPDAIGVDTPEQQQMAQKINEAYTVLRKRKKIKKVRIFSEEENAYGKTSYRSYQAEPKEKWMGEVEERVFCERNIYVPYTMTIDSENHYRKVARGRYLWNPELEEFRMLLISLNHATLELMEQVEHRKGIYDGAQIQEQKFSFQKNIFDCLASQFILPVKSLKKLKEPVQTDKKGRNVYLFHAFLGTKGKSETFLAMAQLREGELLYPMSMEENRLMLADINGVSLGYLSLDDDQLYYIVIPLLRNHMAQVKISVEEVFVRRRQPYQVKVNVNLYLRMEKEREDGKVDRYNNRIAELLNQYEASL